MTHAHARRLRGARRLNAIATRLRKLRLARYDHRTYKIKHPEEAELRAVCTFLANAIAKEAANFRRRKTCA